MLNLHRLHHRQAICLRRQGRSAIRNRPIHHCPTRYCQEGIQLLLLVKPALYRSTIILPLLFVCSSNSVQAEFNTYKQSLAETNSKFPVESTLKKKWEDMKALQDRFWTDADINSRIEKSRKYEHLLSSKGSADSGPRIATQAELNAKRIADLNKKNRIEDSERVRKALIEERRRDMQDRKRREREHLKQKAEEEAKKKAEEEKAAKTLDELFEGDSRAGTPRAGTPKPGEKKKELKKGLPTFRKPKMDDDIIANMDFGVEIEI